jgi:radical SAM superfamily enzyme YgiQ (UPF0313 family)
MVGGFYEEQEYFEMTRKQLVEFKKEGLINSAQISVMTLEPGAPYYKKALEEGWIQDTQFSTSHFEPTLNVPWATKEEIINRQRILTEIVYGK